MSKYICPYCGNIYTQQIKFECPSCNKNVDSNHLYPPFNALNFIATSNELYTNCKAKDKEIKDIIFQTLTNKQKNPNGIYTTETLNLSKDDLSKIIKIYEDVNSKYKDNEISQFNNINDEFEDKLIKKYNFSCDTIDCIISALKVWGKNRLRKPFVIMVASTIEMLFNDYFSLLLKTKLGDKGSSIILNEYKYSSIKSCIEISNAFLDTSLEDEMNNINRGFFDRWSTLRDDRNNIVHSNNKYISMSRTHQIYKLLNESSDVFANLKSNVYKQNQIL